MHSSSDVSLSISPRTTLDVSQEGKMMQVMILCQVYCILTCWPRAAVLIKDQHSCVIDIYLIAYT